jgi:hypothetical protein
MQKMDFCRVFQVEVLLKFIYTEEIDFIYGIEYTVKSVSLN